MSLAPVAVQGGRLHGHQVFAPEQRLAGGRAVFRQQAKHRHHGLGLAGPGLAHDRQALAGLQHKVQAAHGVHLALRCLEADVQVFDFQQRLAHMRSFGSSASRRPSPM